MTKKNNISSKFLSKRAVWPGQILSGPSGRHIGGLAADFFRLSRDMPDRNTPDIRPVQARPDGFIKIFHIFRRMPLTDQPKCVNLLFFLFHPLCCSENDSGLVLRGKFILRPARVSDTGQADGRMRLQSIDFLSLVCAVKIR